jgi:prepilin-type N-terminal cleavage/methylation domain-containing protein
MSKQRGFTLVEVLVVLGIIGVLAGLCYPLIRSATAKAQEAGCLSQLGSLGVALQTYIQEHNDQLPELAQGRRSKTEEIPVIETVLLPYLGSLDAFHCPADAKEFAKTGSSYFWNSTQNGLRTTQLTLFGVQNRPDRVPLIYDKEAWHPRKANFLYGDMTRANKFRTTVGP